MKSILIFLLAIFVLHTIESTHLRKESNLLNNLLRSEAKSKASQTTCTSTQTSNRDSTSCITTSDCGSSYTTDTTVTPNKHTCNCKDYYYNSVTSTCIIKTSCVSVFVGNPNNACGCEGHTYSGSGSTATCSVSARKTEMKTEMKTKCASPNIAVKIAARSNAAVEECKTASECGSLTFTNSSGTTECKCDEYTYNSANSTVCTK
jgi:hypothetical protein